MDSRAGAFTVLRSLGWDGHASFRHCLCIFFGGVVIFLYRVDGFRLGVAESGGGSRVPGTHYVVRVPDNTGERRAIEVQLQSLIDCLQLQHTRVRTRIVVNRRSAALPPPLRDPKHKAPL